MIFGDVSKYCSNKLMVHMGLLSCSLYLVHWPLIVFYRKWNYEGIRSIDVVLILVISYLASLLIYRYIERPFRYNKHSKTQFSPVNVGFATLDAILIVILPSAHAWQNNGWEWHINNINSQKNVSEIKNMNIKKLKN